MTPVLSLTPKKLRVDILDWPDFRSSLHAHCDFPVPLHGKLKLMPQQGLEAFSACEVGWCTSRNMDLFGSLAGTLPGKQSLHEQLAKRFPALPHPSSPARIQFP
eukprot:4127470-Amphidinium_carterae.1